MKIYIRTMTRKKFAFKVEENNTVKEFREKVANRLKGMTSTLNFRLIYSGNELQDEKTLGDYSIIDEDNIYLIYHLK